MRAGFVAVALIAFAAPQARAGLVIGSGPANDKKDDVLSVINAYNVATNPDLSMDFNLFKKTDDNASFVFDSANGFKFFANSNGTGAITTQGGLTSLSTAYFSYTGLENLLYYSVKSGNGKKSSQGGFTLYSFTSGTSPLNLLNVGSQDISHVSFWSGPPGEVASIVTPEPSTYVLAVIAAAILAGRQGIRQYRQRRLHTS